MENVLEERNEHCTQKPQISSNAIKLTLHSKMNLEEATLATLFQNWKKI